MITSTDTSSTAGKFGFLSLPAELRIEVYRYLAEPDEGRPPFYIRQPPLYTGLYLSCSQIKDEFEWALIGHVIAYATRLSRPTSCFTFEIFSQPKFTPPPLSIYFRAAVPEDRSSWDGGVKTMNLSLSKIESIIPQLLALQANEMLVRIMSPCIKWERSANCFFAAFRNFIEQRRVVRCKRVMFAPPNGTSAWEVRRTVAPHEQQLLLLQGGAWVFEYDLYWTPHGTHTEKCYKEVVVRLR